MDTAPRRALPRTGGFAHAAGVVDTGSPDGLGESAFSRRLLLGRMGEPAEIGRAVRFLVREKASSFTASEFVVEGGNISSQRM